MGIQGYKKPTERSMQYFFIAEGEHRDLVLLTDAKQPEVSRNMLIMECALSDDKRGKVKELRQYGGNALVDALIEAFQTDDTDVWNQRMVRIEHNARDEYHVIILDREAVGEAETGDLRFDRPK